MLGYPAGAKVLAKTMMWDGREAAHCTRPLVRLSTATRLALDAAYSAPEIAPTVVDNCAAAH